MTQESDELLAEFAQMLHHPPNPYLAASQTQAFEAALARHFGVQEAIVVSSGTAALHCALAALEIGPGDEVLVPALSVVMSAVPVLYQGATPVFVDCQPDRVDVDYDDMKRKTTAKTRAILPVYLWGCSYNMPRLLDYAHEHRLLVIEDACQAHGTCWGKHYLGTWGDIGCFSLKDGKLLETGEGGFLLTNTPDFAQRCRAFRSHWITPADPTHSYQRLGHNYRLSEWQALLGQHRLRTFEDSVAHRRWQAEYLLKGLAKLPEVVPYCYAKEEVPNYFSPVLFLQSALASRRVAERLAAQGVRNSVGTFGLRPVGTWPVFRAGRSSATQTDASWSTETPNAATMLERTLALILLPQYTAADLDGIIATVQRTIEEEKCHRGGCSHTA